jgi:hypothetical protein
MLVHFHEAPPSSNQLIVPWILKRKGSKRIRGRSEIEVSSSLLKGLPNYEKNPYVLALINNELAVHNEVRSFDSQEAEKMRF